MNLQYYRNYSWFASIADVELLNAALKSCKTKNLLQNPVTYIGSTVFVCKHESCFLNQILLFNTESSAESPFFSEYILLTN